MTALTEFLFPAPARRSLPAIVGWWERRRPAYNLMVGGAGLFSVGVLHLLAQLPPGAYGFPDGRVFWWLPVAAVFGVMANVCYMLGPALEVLIHGLWGRRVLPVGPALYRMGLTFSVGLALLPTLLAGLEWGVRVARWLF